MYVTFHLTSAQELGTDILDAIKALYKSKPITLIIEENERDFELTNGMKTILDERLLEDEKDYLSASDSINRLRNKYG